MIGVFCQGCTAFKAFAVGEGEDDADKYWFCFDCIARSDADDAWIDEHKLEPDYQF